MVDSGYASEATDCLQALIIRIEYNNNAFDNHHLNLFFILFFYYFLQAIRLEMIFQTYFFLEKIFHHVPTYIDFIL